MTDLRTALLSSVKKQRFGAKQATPDQTILPEELVLSYGKEFLSTELTPSEYEIVLAAADTAKRLVSSLFRRGTDAFLNAQMLTLHDPCQALVYVEGFVLYPPVASKPTHHAWATLSGKVVDLSLSVPHTKRPRFANRVLGTLPINTRYIGVEFPDRVEIRERILRRRAVGPLLTEESDFATLFHQPSA